VLYIHSCIIYAHHMRWAHFKQSRSAQFLSGTVAAIATCGAVYLVCDATSDVITMRECQKLVLPLAARHEQLCSALQPPIQAGSMFASSLRTSATGSLVQCNFPLVGQKRTSNVSATVRRQAYATPFLYNLIGPGKWELTNCLVLVGTISDESFDAMTCGALLCT
jgi:hypothetical protein